MTDEATNDTQFLLCSNCFVDEGLRIDSWKHGVEQQGDCPNCKSPDGKKLTKEHLRALAHRFFVDGTTIRFEYGAAPRVQCNEHHYGKSDISPSPWLENDVRLIEDAGKIGFFHYAPRFWMFGEVEPLKGLQEPAARPQIIERVLKEYPERALAKDSSFYQVRVNPQRPAELVEYDSPPMHLAGKGRLDSAGFAVMYGSQDIDICIHECRAMAEDESAQREVVSSGTTAELPSDARRAKYSGRRMKCKIPLADFRLQIGRYPTASTQECQSV